MSDISVRVDSGIGWITFNRPDFRNAISKEMWTKLPALLEDCSTQGAGVVVFSGEGGAFAAGADFADLQKISSRTDAVELWDSIRTALDAVASYPGATIAKIVGPCMGGGCLTAIACDLRYAEPGARFSVPVAKLGIKLDSSNIARLVSLVGYGRAAELLYTAEVISAARAEEFGLVNAVYPLEELDKVVLATTRSIIENSLESVQHSKYILSRQRLPENLLGDEEAVIDSYLGRDFQERLKRI